MTMLNTNTTVTTQPLQDLVDVVCVKPDGTPWTPQGVHNLRRSLSKMLTDAVSHNGGPVTYAQFLTAETITTYCDGTTPRPRDVGDRAIAADNHCQTIGAASIPNIAKVSIRILHHIDKTADTSALEALIAQAEAAASERARVRNAATPSFSVFHDAAAKHGPELLECTCKDLSTLSVLTYLLLQVVVAPTRERMLLYARACDDEDFEPDVDHGTAVLDTMKADHPTHASTIALATVLFKDGEPTDLVLGVHGCTDARKNNFYHRICLTTPILPETAHLLPLVRRGLRFLHVGYTDGNFLLRSSLKPLGDTPFGRNWCSDSVFKPLVGHPVGVLRKSVEQRALSLHVAEPDTFTLDHCVEVHRRCQHRPATAMAAYVAGKLAIYTGMPTDDDMGCTDDITTPTAADDMDCTEAAEVVAATIAAVVTTTAAAATAVIAASDTAMNVKAIVKKWEDEQEDARNPAVDPKLPLHFTRFLDGDDEHFVVGNCVETTPFEWLSAPDGRDWCVSWDAALTDEEKAFVMDKFEDFAAHFRPGAAEARRLLDQAANDHLTIEVATLTAKVTALRTRINALEDTDADTGSVDDTDTDPGSDSDDEPGPHTTALLTALLATARQADQRLRKRRRTA